MQTTKPKLSRYALVDRRDVGAGVRRMKLARVTGLLEVAPSAPPPTLARAAHS